MPPSAVSQDGDASSLSNAVTGAEALCRVITPVGMLGYGFEEDQVIAALEQMKFLPHLPTAIILDSGSTDSGPSKLALGSMTCPRSSYERDLGKLIPLAMRYKVPILISSAGGDGSDDHVETFIDIVKTITSQNGYGKLKVLAIYSEVKKSLILERLENGQISGCGASVPLLTVQDVEQSPRVVAQMGPEPFIHAMAAHPDFNIVIGGRAYDPSPYVAYCAYNALGQQSRNVFDLGKMQLGTFTHMGKVLECGGLCSTPKTMGAYATIYKDCSFTITPLDPSSKCTPLSVAAHTLYEKSRPDILHGPGGYLDLNAATYTSLSDGRTVLVRGSTFHSSASDNLPYTVKLEAARTVGYRTLMIGSFHDPILIPQIDAFLAQVKAHVAKQHTHINSDWHFDFHTYGQQPNSTEIFVVGEALAATQEIANSLASTARIGCSHGSYPGQKATSGTFAMGIGGRFELEAGLCAEFCIYHLMSLRDGEEGAVNDDMSGVVEEASSSVGKPGLFRFKAHTMGSGKEDKRTEPNGMHANIVPIVKANGHNATKADSIVTLDAISSEPRTLIDIAKVIRSKNAGPYELTVDVMFDSREVYNLVKDETLLSAAVIAALYNIPESDVIYAGFFDAAMAFKATIPRCRKGRHVASGGYMENDVHGSQQYMQLMTLPLSDGLIVKLALLKTS